MVGKLDGKTTVVEKTSPSPESSAGTSSAHSPSSVSGVSGIPQPPSLPYWFNRECKKTLMMVGPPPHGPNIPSSSTTFFNPPVPRLLTKDDIKLQLKNQLEYYFSRENLLTDRYLKCQMDSEHFVPINVVAGFPKVSRLTNDIELIVEAVKDSLNLELDENLEKVRAVSKRTTIIIREVPEEFRDEVVRLLDNGPQFTELTYGLNDSWYVTYDNELDTQVAYISVQRRKNELTQKPVCARIKAGGIPASIAPPPEVVSPEPVRLAATTTNGEKGPSIQVLDPGQPFSLGDVGLIPVATYRPGEQMTHYVTPTCSFSVNSYGYAQPMQPPQQSQSMISSQSQQYFYPSSTSTTPRNFDEMSTASSNSTRTTSSNYNNRNGGNRNGGNGSYNHQYYESRNSFSSSNEWRPRGGGSRGGSHRGGYQNNQQTNHRDSHQNSHQNAPQNSYQNSHQTNQQNSRADSHQNSHQSNQQGNHQSNQNEYTGRQNNTRGNWRNGARNGTTNGTTTHQYNSRQNGHQNNWRNEQNGYSSSSTTNWQSNDTQASSNNSYNRSNSNYNNSYNKGYNNGYHSSHNHTYNNRYNSHPSSSSSSDVSSKHVSSEEIETPTNSVPSTPSPPVKKQEEFRVVTPTDLPTPPVWPAPSFDRRRKSSEASSTTITTSTTTNTLTPSTPVTPSDPVFGQEDTLNMVKELSINEIPKEKKEVNGVNHPKPAPKVEQKTFVAVEQEKVKSPPAATKVKTPPVVEASPSFAFEADAFPSLPQKIEPVKPPQKPTFSSVAAGRPKQIKQMPPQKKISYAEKLQQRESLLRK
ncbi:CBN-LARP-5 protein [Caenorhabditis brenneri]|uniref:CBN-LARP-5 protein n=1 Tax=Caenorhabditis brenneri TaxID=135651 RepID=G0NJH0_CAEBE|nr:CBN-LARP-5 protein [Caenorhabditis brenneri]